MCFLFRFIYLARFVPGFNGNEALYDIKTYIIKHESFILMGFNIHRAFDRLYENFVLLAYGC